MKMKIYVVCMFIEAFKSLKNVSFSRDVDYIIKLTGAAVKCCHRAAITWTSYNKTVRIDCVCPCAVKKNKNKSQNKDNIDRFLYSTCKKAQEQQKMNVLAVERFLNQSDAVLICDPSPAQNHIISLLHILFY